MGAEVGVGCWAGFLIGGPRLLVGGFFGILVVFTDDCVVEWMGGALFYVKGCVGCDMLQMIVGRWNRRQGGVRGVSRGFRCRSLRQL